MSGRDRERERDRSDRNSRAQAAAARTNEYFVPRDGIDREVITADICRYLGNDALVRPGTYENPQTRVAQQGYFINAYRNLTTAMISDLKADSDRWEQERRMTASRGQPQNVEYRSSTTHQSRQYYGPTEAAPAPAQGYPAAGGYTAAPAAAQQGVYDSPQYQNSAYSSQPAQGYAGTTNYGAPDSYYVAGANLNVDQGQRDRVSGQTGAIPRTNTVSGYAAPPYSQPDSRGYYAQAGTSTVASASGYSQPADPFYGRAAPVAGTTYDNSTPEVYDSRAYQQDPRATAYADPRTQTYPDTPTSYSQAPPMSSTSSTTATSGSSRRERERDDRESSSRHHGRRR